jgi:hypothetical protein
MYNWVMVVLCYVIKDVATLRFCSFEYHSSVECGENNMSVITHGRRLRNNMSVITLMEED